MSGLRPAWAAAHGASPRARRAAAAAAAAARAKAGGGWGADRESPTSTLEGLNALELDAGAEGEAAPAASASAPPPRRRDPPAAPAQQLLPAKRPFSASA